MNTQRAGVVALVGRPNVGKSTLFNVLTRSRNAIVYDRPGLTRDRQYGQVQTDSNADITLIDTGGLHDILPISTLVDEQIQLAIEEADLIVFVTDAADGVTSLDQQICLELRKSGTDILLGINKIDKVSHRIDIEQTEFYSLGLESVQLSAQTGEGVSSLKQEIESRLPMNHSVEFTSTGLPVAVIGRPNVGKSSLINVLADSHRCVVDGTPGTTRDAVRVVLQQKATTFELIDTAGIRRKGRTNDVVEKFSIVKALDALKYSEVSLLVVDAHEGIVEQDLHLLHYAINAGSAIVLVVNKWDLLGVSEKESCTAEIQRRLRFAPWVSVRFVSALRKTGVTSLFGIVQDLHRRGEFDFTTSYLTEVLEDCVRSHAPPTVGRHAIRLRYAHKIGSHPPQILIHGNQAEKLPASYVRYLENEFRTRLDLAGWPIKLNFRTTTNPFGKRKNKLTLRQQKHRSRLIRHRKSAG